MLTSCCRGSICFTSSIIPFRDMLRRLQHIRITRARTLPPELERGSSVNGWSETPPARISLVVIRGILNFDYTAGPRDRARLCRCREIGPRSSIRMGLKAWAKALRVSRE